MPTEKTIINKLLKRRPLKKDEDVYAAEPFNLEEIVDLPKAKC